MSESNGKTPSQAQIDASNRDIADKGARTEALKAELGTMIGDLEARVWATFKQSDLDDRDGQQQCRFYIEVLRDVQARMEFLIEHGKASQKELITLN